MKCLQHKKISPEIWTHHLSHYQTGGTAPSRARSNCKRCSARQSVLCIWATEGKLHWFVIVILKLKYQFGGIALWNSSFSRSWAKTCDSRHVRLATTPIFKSQWTGIDPHHLNASWHQTIFWAKVSLWVRWWVRRLLLWEKHLPHMSQVYGFSPVWMRSWISRWLTRSKLFPQNVQMNHFSLMRWQPAKAFWISGSCK